MQTKPIQEAGLKDARTLSAIIRKSHLDVAEQFHLTFENCPKHPSFCTPEWIENDFQRGQRYYLYQQKEASLACVAYEDAGPQLAYLNRLSVIPESRKRGIGSRLVDFVLDLAREQNKQTVSIGIIGEHLALQEWYLTRGFTLGASKRFPHLPFSVRYMECTL